MFITYVTCFSQSTKQESNQFVRLPGVLKSFVQFASGRAPRLSCSFCFACLQRHGAISTGRPLFNDLNKKVITGTKLEFDQLNEAEFSLSTSASQSRRILELAVSLPCVQILPLLPFVRQINPVHTLLSYVCRINFDAILPSALRYSKLPLPYRFPHQIPVSFHRSPLRVTYSGHLIFLN